MSTLSKRCERCGETFSPAYRVTKAYWNKRRFCSSECRVEGMRGERRSTYGKTRIPLVERFWSKVDRRGSNECWPWKGAIGVQGYGFLGGSKHLGGIMVASRVSYELNVGPIPSGLCVCHRCDNPPCVNPKHLFLGTRSDNNADKKAKGRGADHHGTNNPNSKLGVKDVAKVRRLRKKGLSQQKIADRFGVSQVAISLILRGATWKSVTG